MPQVVPAFTASDAVKARLQVKVPSTPEVDLTNVTPVEVGRAAVASDSLQRAAAAAGAADDAVVLGGVGELEIACFKVTAAAAGGAAATAVTQLEASMTKLSDDFKASQAQLRDDFKASLDQVRDDFKASLDQLRDQMVDKVVEKVTAEIDKKFENKFDSVLAHHSNMSARHHNRMSGIVGDFELQPLKVERHDHSKRPGELPETTDKGSIFPMTHAAVLSLANSELDALQSFYGEDFSGNKLAVRVNKFKAFIGAVP